MSDAFALGKHTHCLTLALYVIRELLTRLVVSGAILFLGIVLGLEVKEYCDNYFY